MAELWSWLTRTPDGRVSQVGAVIEGQGHVSLTFTTGSVATSAFIRAIADQHRRESGQPVWLARFTDPETVEILTGTVSQ